MTPPPTTIIADVANEQANLGMLRSMARILDVLEAYGDAEVDVISLNTIFDLIHSHHFSFMFMPAEQLDEHPPPGAAFAVQFTAIAPRDKQPLCLAYATTRFKEMYSAEWGSRDMRLVKMHYQFTETVVFGVMFYDALLSDVYDMTLDRARRRDDDRFVFHGDHPVSLWNTNPTDFAEGFFHMHCEAFLYKTRLMLKQLYGPIQLNEDEDGIVVEYQTRGTLHQHALQWITPAALSSV